MPFRFDIALDEILGAIFAPILEAIGQVFAAIIEFLAALLAPILEPIFAPIVEAIVAAYLFAIGLVFTLIWALITALHLARYARGISFLGYAMAVLGLTFLIFGAAGVHPWSPDEASRVWSQQAVTGAIVLSVMGFMVGAAAAKTPQERTAQAELRLATAQGPVDGPAPVRKWPGVLGLIMIGTVVGGLAVWMLQPAPPALPDCAPEDRLRQAAADFLSERGNTRSAEFVEPAPCQDR